jgi:hypothetical protein
MIICNIQYIIMSNLILNGGFTSTMLSVNTYSSLIGFTANTDYSSGSVTNWTFNIPSTTSMMVYLLNGTGGAFAVNLPYNGGSSQAVALEVSTSVNATLYLSQTFVPSTEGNYKLKFICRSRYDPSGTTTSVNISSVDSTIIPFTTTTLTGISNTSWKLFEYNFTISNIGKTYKLLFTSNWFSSSNNSIIFTDVSISFIPPVVPCFLQGSKILHYDPISAKESYIPVETLKKGDLVKTFMSGYKPVSHIGWKIMNNPAEHPDIRDRLYGLSAKQVNPSAEPEIDEPLYLTGRHSVLRNDLIGSDLDLLIKYMGDIFVTENHYRVPIFLDQRATPYTDNSPVTIWHFALENHNIYHNYGVYANGLLVESCSIQYLTELADMELNYSRIERGTSERR